jgi:hypothetical protein
MRAAATPQRQLLQLLFLYVGSGFSGRVRDCAKALFRGFEAGFRARYLLSSTREQRDQNRQRDKDDGGCETTASGFCTWDPMPVEIAAGSRPTPAITQGRYASLMLPHLMER